MTGSPPPSANHSEPPAAPPPEALVEAITSGLDLGVAVIDPDGKIVRWNRAAERLTGWTASEAVGGPMPVVPISRWHEFRGILDRVLEGETIRGRRLSRRRKDGTAFDMRLWAAPIRNEVGDITHVLVVVDDDAERTRSLRMALDTALQKLEERDLERAVLRSIIEIEGIEGSVIDLELQLDAIQVLTAADLCLKTIEEKHPELADDQEISAVSGSLTRAVQRLREPRSRKAG